MRLIWRTSLEDKAANQLRSGYKSGRTSQSAQIGRDGCDSVNGATNEELHRCRQRSIPNGANKHTCDEQLVPPDVRQDPAYWTTSVGVPASRDFKLTDGHCTLDGLGAAARNLRGLGNRYFSLEIMATGGVSSPLRISSRAKVHCDLQGLSLDAAHSAPPV
jgi:hypothetical protein